jgi:hypothetical protein
MFRSAVATQSGSPKATSRCYIKADRPSSPTSPFSRTYSRIWRKASPLSWFNAYRIFDCSSGKLMGLCRITIRSYAIQPLKRDRSDPETSGESGSFCPISSCPWGGIGATRDAKESTFSNCVLKLAFSMLASCASLVMSSGLHRISSSVPSVLGIRQACSRSLFNCCISWSQAE